MSAFHRVDDIMEMDPVRFFRLAPRLYAYKGVLRAFAEAEEMKKSKKGGRHGSGAPAQNKPVEALSQNPDTDLFD